MSSASNPLTGSGWGNNSNQPQQNNLLQGALGNLPQMGQQGISSPGQNAGGTTGYGNPGGFNNPLGANEINRNMGLTNIITGQMKNQLAPSFANAMGQYGGQAGNFFSQLTNLGSPYYQQQQTASNNAGVLQNQNAMNQAQQQLAAQGYGNTPSGANAAMIGGMQQAGAQSLAENYLQNLFQNEQMQLQGAQGLGTLAGMFNPSQLLGGTSVGANVQAPSSFFQNFAQVGEGIGAMLGGGGKLASGLNG